MKMNMKTCKKRIIDPIYTKIKLSNKNILNWKLYTNF